MAKYILVELPKKKGKYVPAKVVTPKSKYIPYKPPTTPPKYVPWVPKKKKSKYIPVVYDKQAGKYVPLNAEDETAKAPSDYATAQYTLPPDQMSQYPPESIPTAYWSPGWIQQIGQNVNPYLLYSYFRMLGMRRGIDYPEDYYGLVGFTRIRIVKLRDSSDVRCKIHLGSDLSDSDRDSDSRKFEKIDQFHEAAKITFYNNGVFNSNYKDMFKGPVDTDLFDHVYLQRDSCGFNDPMEITNVKIWLNDVVICDASFNPPKVLIKKERLDLTNHIKHHRLSKINFSDNTILRTAALEIGKAWSPKYGGEWLCKIYPRGKRVWESDPKAWCTEFCRWVFRSATSYLDIPDNVNWHNEMAEWFMERGLYIDPNPDNINYCAFEDLGSRIQPGYYSRVRSWLSNPDHIVEDVLGHQDDSVGHSTIFFKWGNMDSNNFAHFKGLGGSQNDIVCILSLIHI